MTPGHPARTPPQGNAPAEAGPAPPGEGRVGSLPAGPLVLYDGDCGLCARSVRFILEHERDHQIVFAPLQGPTAALARQRHPRIPQSVDSVVYISDGRAHLRSKAMLHAATHLRAPWRWGHALRWVPGFLLDLAYRVVAAVRYRIWGHADACRMATPEQRPRFLP
jgi:predicted DCC family thiol-disulfide oxidoreductase YuxK